MSHVDPARVLAIAALDVHDPERVQALAHADGCPRCRAALREGEHLMAAIDNSFELPVVSPALRARVLARPARWPRLALALGLLTSLWLAWSDARSPGTLLSAIAGHCAVTEAGFALVPLAAAIWLTRAGRVRLDPPAFAAASCAGALAGQLWLSAGHCSVHDQAIHAFGVHFLVLLGAALAGGLAGRRWLSRAA